MSPEKEESKRRGRVLSSHWARVHQSVTGEPVEKLGELVILPHRQGLSRGEAHRPVGRVGTGPQAPASPPRAASRLLLEKGDRPEQTYQIRGDVTKEDE